MADPDEFPTFTAGGTKFVVVPLALAAAHGLGVDEAARRRRALGRKLRRARERAGLTQVDLAEKLGTLQPSVSAVEHGREACSDERAEKWIAACQAAGESRP